MLKLIVWMLLSLAVVVEIAKAMRYRSGKFDVLWTTFLTWNCFLVAFVY